MEKPKLTLRQVREEDRWQLWEWRNSPRIRRVSTNDEEIPRESHDAWFTARLPQMRDRTVIVEVDGIPIGWFQIERWDESSRSGEWGVALGEKPPIYGLGRSLPLLAHAHAFERLSASELIGRVVESNDRMIPAMEALAIPRARELDRTVQRADGDSRLLLGFRVTAAQWPQVREAASAALTPEVREILHCAIESEIRG